jgi:membrane protease YdiL (CAAX protease family)
MTLREFLFGRPHYDLSHSSGSPRLVVPVTVVILVLGQIGTALLLYLSGLLSDPAPATGGGAVWPPAKATLMAMTLASQLVTAALTVLAARRAGIVRALRLEPPAEGWSICLWALLVLVPLVAIFNGLAYLLAPGMMARDFAAFRDLVRGDHVLLTALVLGLGAPLWEELLFRGFLLSSIAGSALGFWPGAALATAAWAALHLEYTVLGLLEVFLMGLYFSWVLWRTGSLWPALICHGVYNLTLFAVLRQLTS